MAVRTAHQVVPEPAAQASADAAAQRRDATRAAVAQASAHLRDALDAA